MYNFIFCHIFKYFESWYLSTGNEIMLVTSNLALKHFPKFFYAKVHLQYKHAIYEAINMPYMKL